MLIRFFPMSATCAYPVVCPDVASMHLSSRSYLPAVHPAAILAPGHQWLAWAREGLASSCPHPLPPLGWRQPFCLLKPYSQSLSLSCYSPYSLNWGVYAVQDPLTHPQPSLLHVNLLSKHIHLCWQPATDKYQILMALPLAIGQVILLTPSASSLVTSTVLS